MPSLRSASSLSTKDKGGIPVMCLGHAPLRDGCRKRMDGVVMIFSRTLSVALLRRDLPNIDQVEEVRRLVKQRRFCILNDQLQMFHSQVARELKSSSRG